MVERRNVLDNVFGSLSDPIRRSILKQVSKHGLSMGEIAKPYTISFAAVAKHIDVLHRARLIRKTRRGKEQIISIIPPTLAVAVLYLDAYRPLWEKRLDSLDTYLKTINQSRQAGSRITGKGKQWTQSKK